MEVQITDYLDQPGQAAEAALTRHRFAIKLLFAVLGVAILVVCLLRADTLPGQPDQRTADANTDVQADAESAYFENSASFLNRVHHIQSEDLARSATRTAAQVVDTRAKHEAKKETVSSIFVVDDGAEDCSTFCIGEGGGAFDSSWDAKYDRKAIWFTLREYIWENNIKVLFGTLISCNETADDADWAYVKELMGYIGWYYTMGLAIGNEVELIHKHPSSSPACNARLFQGKYFQNKVMGGYVLSGAPFINTPFAGVADFFRYVSGRYGRRWVYTWNVYPYFDPNVQVNPADPAACGKVLYAAQSFAVDGMITTQLRSLRASTQADVTWLGETGWSFPQATTLHTPMSACPGFSGPENFLKSASHQPCILFHHARLDQLADVRVLRIGAGLQEQALQTPLTHVDRSLKANPLRIRVCMEVHAESQSTAWQHRLP
eukprot:s321_g10.t1